MLSNANLLLSLFLLVCSPVFAIDDVTILKQKLSALGNQSTIQVELTSSFIDTLDEDKKSGEISVILHSDDTGFHTFYPQVILDKMSAESAAKSNDDNAKSPTIDAANKLNAVNLHRMISDATSLQQFLANAEFKGARNIIEEGNRYRELIFDIPMELLVKHKKTRQYVDDFESQYRLLLDESGYPAKSFLTYQGSGSAYFIFSVQAYGESSSQYQVINDRLVQINNYSKTGSKSMFGDFERQIENRLVVIENKRLNAQR